MAFISAAGRPAGESGSILTVVIVTMSFGATALNTAAARCFSSSASTSARPVSSSDARMRWPVRGPSRISCGLLPKNAGELATALLLAMVKCSER